LAAVSVARIEAGSSRTADVVRMEPTSGWVLPRLRDSWQRRELVFFFARRDIKIKYAQTMLGWLWTLVQPVGMMLVFTLAFQKLGKIETQGVDYPVFVFAGLTFWLFFSRSVANASDSLVTNAQILTKTSCPRLLMPVSGIVSGLFDLLVTAVLFFGFALLYQEYPTWRLAFLPLVVLVGAAFALGLALLFSAVNVRHRDVRNALPLALQLWLFLSPIAYPLDTLGEPWKTFFALNPLSGIIEAFRWSFLATPLPPPLALAAPGLATVVFLVVGLAYFARAERIFADVA
jgi:lipopolysaccharide transport system permease protein